MSWSPGGRPLRTARRATHDSNGNSIPGSKRKGDGREECRARRGAGHPSSFFYDRSPIVSLLSTLVSVTAKAGPLVLESPRNCEIVTNAALIGQVGVVSPLARDEIVEGPVSWDGGDTYCYR